MPAAIDNNLPGTEISIGADTALNNIVEMVDKIKQSAVATRRCFVVEVMGRQCGYLALMSSIATGAERAYLPEEGITLHDLEVDLAVHETKLPEGSTQEPDDPEREGQPAVHGGLHLGACSSRRAEAFSTCARRSWVIVQQGGDPSPFDRIQATRLAARCVAFLVEAAADGETNGAASPLPTTLRGEPLRGRVSACKTATWRSTTWTPSRSRPTWITCGR